MKIPNPHPGIYSVIKNLENRESIKIPRGLNQEFFDYAKKTFGIPKIPIQNEYQKVSRS